MTLTRTRELSGDKLKENFGSAISLTLVVMISYLCINLIGKIIAMFFSTVMIDFYIIKDFSPDSIIASVITLVLTLFLLSPLRLSIKKWYQDLDGEYLPIPIAFEYFASFKKYISVFYFCMVRFIAVFITCLVAATPCIILAAILKCQFSLNIVALDSLFGALTILFVVLLIVGIIFSIYFSIGFFFTDYIYIKGITRNPFKALFLSRKLSKKNSKSLGSIIVASLPYYLLCLLLVTIPFAIPKIRAMFAVYADEILYQ